MRTMYRRIRFFGLLSYRPRLVLPLTAGHRRQRWEWCRERQQWREEWHNMVFSDESRFCLGMHDGRRRVRRRRGERPDTEFAVERPIHRTVGAMVWGAIGYGSRSPSIFIRGSQYDICALHKRSSATVFVALPKWSSSANTYFSKITLVHI
jgi:hypothetical protein